MNYFKTFRDLAICMALLIVPFFFLSAHLKDPSKASLLDKILLQVSSPVQYAASWTADAASAIVEDYVYLVDVRNENERLLADNDRLREHVRQLRFDAQRSNQLEELLGLQRRFETQSISGRVIARDISSSFRVTRIAVDRGGQEGITAGMPVISSEGLVGQIRRVSGRFSDVLLTIDAESRVDVIVQRTGARGRLEGLGERGRYLCRIQFDRREDEVQVGDEIYTSGMGKKFPKAILVGTITKINQQDYGLHQEGEVTPSVDFSRLDEVLVLTGQGRDQKPPRAGEP